MTAIALPFTPPLTSIPRWLNTMWEWRSLLQQQLSTQIKNADATETRMGKKRDRNIAELPDATMMVMMRRDRLFVPEDWG